MSFHLTDKNRHHYSSREKKTKTKYDFSFTLFLELALYNSKQFYQQINIFQQLFYMC